MKTRTKYQITSIILLLFLLLTSCSSTIPTPSFSLSEVPAFDDFSPYVVIDENQPSFEIPSEITCYKKFSKLDMLGRCGAAEAMLGTELMPTEERDSIGQIKPSGWQTVKYDIVEGKYLYNRCHLIGFQLCGENANKNNLITGTRFMNNEGMLPFENMIANYLEQTKNHVLYRVTPIYYESNLVASGVHMEALSVEDGGKGVCFNVYVYNEQPGITINHKNGDSHETQKQQNTVTPQSEKSYILNTKSKKIHYSTCSEAKEIQSHNRVEYTDDVQKLLKKGYTFCKICEK